MGKRPFCAWAPSCGSFAMVPHDNTTLDGCAIRPRSCGMPPFFETLVACPSCNCHAKGHEAVCPHCGAALRRVDGGVQKTAIAVLMGLTTAAVTPALATAGCDGG